MSWKSLPSWTPALLRGHVVLLVEWLRLANALKRSRPVFLAMAGIVLVTAGLTIRASGLVAVLADYWLLTPDPGLLTPDS